MGNRGPAMRYTHHRKGASGLPWLLADIGVLVGLTAFTLASLHTGPANSSEVTTGHSRCGCHTDDTDGWHHADDKCHSWKRFV